jgi:hypothetical protein
VIERMSEQFHDREVEIMRGREDIGYLLAGVRALCSRASRPLSTALTEDDETCVEPIGCGLGQEIFQSLPVFLSGPLHINFDTCDRRSTLFEEQRPHRRVCHRKRQRR